jgi:hypothetical protein
MAHPENVPTLTSTTPLGITTVGVGCAITLVSMTPMPS